MWVLAPSGTAVALATLLSVSTPPATSGRPPWSKGSAGREGNPRTSRSMKAETHRRRGSMTTKGKSTSVGRCSDGPGLARPERSWVVRDCTISAGKPRPLERGVWRQRTALSRTRGQSMPRSTRQHRSHEQGHAHRSCAGNGYRPAEERDRLLRGFVDEAFPTRKRGGISGDRSFMIAREGRRNCFPSYATLW